jgi:hypothetical protein
MARVNDATERSRAQSSAATILGNSSEFTRRLYSLSPGTKRRAVSTRFRFQCNRFDVGLIICSEKWTPAPSQEVGIIKSSFMMTALDSHVIAVTGILELRLTLTVPQRNHDKLSKFRLA